MKQKEKTEQLKRKEKTTTTTKKKNNIGNKYGVDSEFALAVTLQPFSSHIVKWYCCILAWNQEVQRKVQGLNTNSPNVDTAVHQCYCFMLRTIIFDFKHQH